MTSSLIQLLPQILIFFLPAPPFASTYPRPKSTDPRLASYPSQAPPHPSCVRCQVSLALPQTMSQLAQSHAVLLPVAQAQPTPSLVLTISTTSTQAHTHLLWGHTHTTLRRPPRPVSRAGLGLHTRGAVTSIRSSSPVHILIFPVTQALTGLENARTSD